MTNLSTPYLKKTLDRLGVKYSKSASNADLMKLLDDLCVKNGIGCGCSGGGKSNDFPKPKSGFPKPRSKPPVLPSQSEVDQFVDSISRQKELEAMRRRSRAPSRDRSHSRSRSPSPSQHGAGKSGACNVCDQYVKRSRSGTPFVKEEARIIAAYKTGCEQCAKECSLDYQAAKALKKPAREIRRLNDDCIQKLHIAANAKRDHLALTKRLESALERLSEFQEERLAGLPPAPQDEPSWAVSQSETAARSASKPDGPASPKRSPRSGSASSKKPEEKTVDEFIEEEFVKIPKRRDNLPPATRPSVRRSYTSEEMQALFKRGIF
jgi:hypothetical protein